MTKNNTHTLVNETTKKKTAKAYAVTSHVPNVKTQQAMIEAREITKARFNYLDDQLKSSGKLIL